MLVPRMTRRKERWTRLSSVGGDVPDGDKDERVVLRLWWILRGTHICSIVLSAGFVVVANDLSMILRDNFLQVLWKLKFVSISA